MQKEETKLTLITMYVFLALTIIINSPVEMRFNLFCFFAFLNLVLILIFTIAISYIPKVIKFFNKILSFKAQ